MRLTDWMGNRSYDYIDNHKIISINQRICNFLYKYKNQQLFIENLNHISIFSGSSYLVSYATLKICLILLIYIFFVYAYYRENWLSPIWKWFIRKLALFSCHLITNQTLLDEAIVYSVAWMQNFRGFECWTKTLVYLKLKTKNAFIPKLALARWVLSKRKCSTAAIQYEFSWRGWLLRRRESCLCIARSIVPLSRS